MKKTVLLFLALWLCSLTFMAAPFSQQQARQVVAQLDETETSVVTFETVNKPAGWADLKVTKSNTSEEVKSGSTVARNELLTFVAAEGSSHHVEWFVNGKKASGTNATETFSITEDTHVVASYV